MKPTDTPRTNAVEYNSGRVTPERYAVDADWARCLEREINDLREALTEAVNKRAATCEWKTAPERWVRDDLCEKWRGVLANAEMRERRSDAHRHAAAVRLLQSLLRRVGADDHEQIYAVLDDLGALPND